MNSFRQWYLEHATQITWFLIGFLTLDGCNAIGRGDLLGAFLSFSLAFINYKLN
jgi:hypothetical protein